MDLAKFGLFEHNGVLIQKFPNGKAMQVRLEPDRVDVRSRQISADKITDTESDTPPWFLANGYILAEWRKTNSPVWQWLLEKGLDEAAAISRMLNTGKHT